MVESVRTQIISDMLPQLVHGRTCKGQWISDRLPLPVHDRTCKGQWISDKLTLPVHGRTCKRQCTSDKLSLLFCGRTCRKIILLPIKVTINLSARTRGISDILLLPWYNTTCKGTMDMWYAICYGVWYKWPNVFIYFHYYQPLGIYTFAK